MAEGVITYSASIIGLELEPFEFNPPYPFISHVSIHTESETRLFIQVHLIDVYSKADAQKLTSDLVNIIIARLAFAFNCAIGEPRCVSVSLPVDDTGKKSMLISEIVLVNDLLEGTMKPSRRKIEELRIELAKLYDEKDLYLQAFRFAISQKDPISRFMFLYNLLLMIFGDKQKFVDENICKLDSQVPVFPSPIRSGEKETIFTRLRNEIAHARKDSGQMKTKEEICNYIVNFQTIALKAIDLL